MSEELDRVKAALAAAEEVVTQEEAQEAPSAGEAVAVVRPEQGAAARSGVLAALAGRGVGSVPGAAAGAIALGEVVHYRLREGRNLGDVRPAMVVRVWEAQAGVVNLAVFADFWNDGLNCPSWATSVHAGDAPGEYRRVV